jgi:hypothetical protein
MKLCGSGGHSDGQKGTPMLEPELKKHSTEVDLRQLREFSAIWLVFFCAMGTWQWFANANLKVLVLLCALGLLVGLPGLVRPTLVTQLF